MSPSPDRPASRARRITSASAVAHTPSTSSTPSTPSTSAGASGKSATAAPGRSSARPSAGPPGRAAGRPSGRPPAAQGQPPARTGSGGPADRKSRANPADRPQRTERPNPAGGRPSPAAGPAAAGPRPARRPARTPATEEADDGIRLAKRVMVVADCSRTAAERLIEAGRVSVDGRVRTDVTTRVRPEQAVTVMGSGPAAPLSPVTLLLHKPAGLEADDWATLLDDAHQHPTDRSGVRLAKPHLKGLQCATPLERAASGLVVLTQVPGVIRTLVEEGSRVEHEVLVEVGGAVSAQQLRVLNASAVVDGRAMLPARASVNQTLPDTTRLRLALKGYHPGQILQLCDQADLTLRGIRRIRVGRLPLRDLAPGQWRALMPYERF